ncbi:hypothetical protein GCM10023205_67400 [Yinghuangia aomiensis]|uniref:HTH tetR-type domain-containing protein n=1 Tax=Yinghuangia aomiensis TaxID=676205 RepID=A0ABP9I4X5_9ACTN
MTPPNAAHPRPSDAFQRGIPPRHRSPRRRGHRRTKEEARRDIVEAAVDCILELGFYRASTNEIARRADVAWSSIQHHFGSREALWLAVVVELGRRFNAELEHATVEAATLEERLRLLYDVLAAHYGDPVYLAAMQVGINLDRDPATSPDVTAALAEEAAENGRLIHRLFAAALGPDAGVGSIRMAFHTMRGSALSLQLVTSATWFSSDPPASADLERQIEQLITAIAAGVRLDPGVRL